MKRFFNRSLFLYFVLLIAVAAANGQTQIALPNAAKDVYKLVIVNEENRQTELTAAALGRLPRLSVKASDHGKEAVFEGYALVEVLKLAGIEFGDKLRGKRLANYLLVEAADNYRAVFALPELDPAFTDEIVLLADRRDGKPLSKEEGNFRLVVPHEKKQARWVRQITRLTLLRARN